MARGCQSHPIRAHVALKYLAASLVSFFPSLANPAHSMVHYRFKFLNQIFRPMSFHVTFVSRPRERSVHYVGI
jgi:hypothetical protein